MTGPGLALIIIPITTTTGLVVWLTMVFSADSRPRRADRNPLGTHASTPGQTAECLPGAAATARGIPAPRRDPRIASHRWDKWRAAALASAGRVLGSG